MKLVKKNLYTIQFESKLYQGCTRLITISVIGHNMQDAYQTAMTEYNNHDEYGDIIKSTVLEKNLYMKWSELNDKLGIFKNCYKSRDSRVVRTL